MENTRQKEALELRNECRLVDATNLKKFFMEADAIVPLRQELTFSIFRRYNCYAGCKICYTDRYFEKNKSKFSRFIPTEIPKELEQKWFELFEHYVYVSTHDEMYYLKMKQPHLFEWYVKNADKFYFGSATDNAYVRNVDIFLNDIDNCLGIYEVAFSENWLKKVNFDKIITSLREIYAKHDIIQVKVIQQTDGFYETEEYKTLKEFCDTNDIIFALYQNILTDKETIMYFDKPEQENFASYDEEYYSICGQSPDYLQYDSFFITLVDAILPEIDPYDVLDDNFNFADHMWKHILGKQDLYNRYYQKIKNSKNEFNMKFAEYYKFVTDEVKVNEDFNYIPYFAIPTNSKLYWKMVDYGWTPTRAGLINLKEQKEVKPLYYFKKT